MKTFRHITFTRFIWLFVALNILNFSVDAPDGQPDYEEEDLAVNDMESIVEIVLEEIANIDNAIPEHDEQDTEQSSLSKVKKSFDFYDCLSKKITFPSIIIQTKFSSRNKSLWEQFSPEITPPPPKA